jgi:hypothetical protein
MFQYVRCMWQFTNMLEFNILSAAGFLQNSFRCWYFSCILFLVSCSNAHRWSHFFHLSTATNYTIKWSNIYTTQISDHNHVTRQNYIRYYDRLLWMSYSHVSCTPQKQVTIKQPKSSVKKFTCSYLHCNVTFAASQRHLSNHQNTLV